MADVIVTTDPLEAAAAVQAAVASVTSGAVRGLSQGGALIAGRASGLVAAARYDTGELAASIAPTPPVVTEAAAEVDVVAGSDHAIFVEVDCVPHWPPIAAITPWADRHGIPPFLVARAISRHGTKGIGFMRNAYATSRDEVVGLVAAGAAEGVSA